MSSESTTATQRPVVVFDGTCAFCRRQERTIRRLDWLRRLDTMPYDAAVEQWAEVGRGTLGDGLRVRFADGSVTIGIDAVRSVGVRMPLTALFSLLLWVPGLHRLGAHGYAFIAARRQRLGGSDPQTDGSCSI